MTHEDKEGHGIGPSLAEACAAVDALDDSTLAHWKRLAAEHMTSDKLPLSVMGVIATALITRMERAEQERDALRAEVETVKADRLRAEERAGEWMVAVSRANTVMREQRKERDLLRAEVERLREALREVHAVENEPIPFPDAALKMIRLARAALASAPPAKDDETNRMIEGLHDLSVKLEAVEAERDAIGATTRAAVIIEIADLLKREASEHARWSGADTWRAAEAMVRALSSAPPAKPSAVPDVYVSCTACGYLGEAPHVCLQRTFEVNPTKAKP